MSEKSGTKFTTFKARYLWGKILFGLALPSIISEVRISGKEIVIKNFYGQLFKYRWKEISESFLIEITGGDVFRKNLVLRTKNKHFVLRDLYAEDNETALEKVLQKYLKISNHKYKNNYQALFMSIIVFFCLVILFENSGNWLFLIGSILDIALYLIYLNKLNDM